MYFDEFIAPSSILKSPMNDINGIDWMAQQNGGQFDPVLFGDYRDPQDSILNNNFGGFFNDAFVSQDFGSPFNTGEVVASPPLKRDLLKEIETQQNEDDTVGPMTAQSTDSKQRMPCNNKQLLSVLISRAPISGMREANEHADLLSSERIQGSEKVKSGEFDMDSLCAQLKAKAKCNGTEPTIDPKDIDDIIGPAHEPEPASQKDFMKMFS